MRMVSQSHWLRNWKIWFRSYSYLSCVSRLCTCNHCLIKSTTNFLRTSYTSQYFALSGLKTNLGLLDNGITWGFTILICAVAFFSKFIACAGVALCAGFSWRESGAIGALMSCKGYALLPQHYLPILEVTMPNIITV